MSSTKLARYRMRAIMAASSTGLLIGASIGAAYLGGHLAHAQNVHVAQLAQNTKSVSATITPAVPVLRASTLTTMSNVMVYADHPQPSMVVSPASAMVFKAHSTSDSDCLSQAVYYEARGEGQAGMQAVAQVILNRVRHPAFPKSICGVVYQGAGLRTGCQFSFACDGTMNQAVESGAWSRAKKVASAALAGYVMKTVGTATNFHTVNVNPGWSATMVQVATVGSHIFYQFRHGAHIAHDANGVVPSGDIPVTVQAAMMTAVPADGGSIAPVAPATQDTAAPVVLATLTHADPAPVLLKAIPMSAQLNKADSTAITNAVSQAQAPTASAPAKTSTQTAGIAH